MTLVITFRIGKGKRNLSTRKLSDDKSYDKKNTILGYSS